MILRPALYHEKIPLNKLFTLVIINRIFTDLLYNELCIVYILLFYNVLMHSELNLDIRLKLINSIKLIVYYISSEYAF